MNLWMGEDFSIKKGDHAMEKKGKGPGKITKKVRLFLSLDPLRIIEGTVTIPSSRARLSDLLNDERAYLAIQEVKVPEGWLDFISNFVLLSKKEIKAVVELDKIFFTPPRGDAAIAADILPWNISPDSFF